MRISRLPTVAAHHRLFADRNRRDIERAWGAWEPWGRSVRSNKIAVRTLDALGVANLNHFQRSRAKGRSNLASLAYLPIFNDLAGTRPASQPEFMIASFGNSTLLSRVKFPKLAIMARSGPTGWAGGESRPNQASSGPLRGQSRVVWRSTMTISDGPGHVSSHQLSQEANLAWPWLLS